MAKPKQPRKEVVSFRLEPKIKYLVDIAARIQRRSPTNYIEYTLENSLRDIEIEKGKSLLSAGVDLWSDREDIRFLKIAESYPELLTFEESEILSFINFRYRSLFLINEFNEDQESTNTDASESKNYTNIFLYWPVLKRAVHDNEADKFLEFLNFVESKFSHLHSFYMATCNERLEPMIKKLIANENNLNQYEKLFFDAIKNTYISNGTIINLDELVDRLHVIVRGLNFSKLK